MLCRNMCTAAVISIFTTKCSYSFEVLQIQMAVELMYRESKYVTMLLKVLLSFMPNYIKRMMQRWHLTSHSKCGRCFVCCKLTLGDASVTELSLRVILLWLLDELWLLPPLPLLPDFLSFRSECCLSKTVGQMQTGGSRCTRLTPSLHSGFTWLAQRLWNWNWVKGERRQYNCDINAL